MPPKILEQIVPDFHLYFSGKSGTEVEINNASKDFEDHIEAAVAQSAVPGIECIFIVHGFQNDINAEWMHRLKDAILKNSSNSFVFIVGWGNGAKCISYPDAALNTYTVANWLAKYLQHLKDNCKRVESIRCIGHSLGAHLVGSAGLTCKKIDRIDALDPAGPLFTSPILAPVEWRLSKEKANFVQVIHTDGFHKALLPLGTLLPMGHVDFYPNYGGNQQGTLHADVAHSHSMAYEFYIKSVESKSIFKATCVLKETPSNGPCKVVKKANAAAQMGFWCETSSRGLYYLDPNDFLVIYHIYSAPKS